MRSGCAKGTFQIAHRNSLSCAHAFFYVQFGTSLLHIGTDLLHMRSGEAHAFVFQEGALFVQAAGIAGEAAV